MKRFVPLLIVFVLAVGSVTHAAAQEPDEATVNDGWNLLSGWYIQEHLAEIRPGIDIVFTWYAESETWDMWIGPPWMLAESGPTAGTVIGLTRAYWVHYTSPEIPDAE